MVCKNYTRVQTTHCFSCVIFTHRKQQFSKNVDFKRLSACRRFTMFHIVLRFLSSFLKKCRFYLLIR